nr:lac repressor [Candidatus Pantoea persica]
MRILIVGADATGGYFGACLAQAGRDVTFLVRERRFKQLQENGLVLRTPQGVEKLQPQLTRIQQALAEGGILAAVARRLLQQQLSCAMPPNR